MPLHFNPCFKDASKCLASLLILSVAVPGIATLVGLDSQPPNLPGDAAHSEPPQSAPPSFEDQTLLQGLSVEHRQESGGISDIKDALGPGLCIGDINGDWIDDVLFVTGSGSTRKYGKKSWWLKHRSLELYINQNGTLRNATAEFGLQIEHATMGCLLADFDNDGYNDLIVTSFTGTYLYRNVEGSRFKLVKSFSDTAKSMWSTGATLIDANGDNLPDVYLSHYTRYRKNQKTFEGDSGFAGGNKGALDPRLYDGESNQLLINNGNFSFSDSTSRYFPADDKDRSLSALTADFNSDGHDDLLVLNDEGSPSRLYVKKNDRFVEDLNYQSPFKLVSSTFGLPYSEGLLISRPSGLGLTYLQHHPTLKAHEDRGWELGLNSTKLLASGYWGSVSEDFDLDGDDDVFLATGLRVPDPYAPKHTVAQRDVLFLKTFAGFTPTAASAPIRGLTSARSTGSSDINFDGKPDLIVTSNNSAAKVLINTTPTPSNWIGLKATQPTMAALTQSRWSRTSRIGLIPLFLGSQNSFKIIALPSSADVQITIGATTATLKANSHYVYDGNSFSAIRATASKSDEPELKFLPLFVQKAWLLKALAFLDTEPAYDGLMQIDDLIGNTSSSTELRQFVLQQPKKTSLLHFYIDWASDLEPPTRSMAWSAILEMESERSIRYLLELFDSTDAQRACELSKVFTAWFIEEEAAIKSKHLAVPYFIRQLDSTDPRIIRCAAQALGASEHITAYPALISAYRTVVDAEARASIIQALGSVRQSEAIPFLDKLFKPQAGARVLVDVTIALNRLSPLHGDRLLSSAFSDSVYSWTELADLADRVLSAENSRHFSAAALEAASSWINRNTVHIKHNIDELPASSQLSFEYRLGHAASDESILSIIDQGDASAIRTIETVLERRGTISSHVAHGALASVQWSKLTTSSRALFLRSLGSRDLEHWPRLDLVLHNLIADIGLMPVALQLKVLYYLQDDFALTQGVEAYVCRHPPSIGESKITRMAASSGPRPLLIDAYITPSVIDSLGNKSASAWLLGVLSRRTNDEHRTLIDCLSKMKLPRAMALKLDMLILGLPDHYENLKAQWLLSVTEQRPAVAAGVERRFARDEVKFMYRYLNMKSLTDFSPALLQYISQNSSDQNLLQFADYMAQALSSQGKTDE